MDSTAAGFSIGGLLLMAFAALIGLAVFAFWIWMLIHAITNKGLRDPEKIVWVIVIVFLHFIGALVYFFVGRPKGAGGVG